MAAYSNERAAAIIASVLYRMLTDLFSSLLQSHQAASSSSGFPHKGTMQTHVSVNHRFRQFLTQFL